jgi:hypothetical protein
VAKEQTLNVVLGGIVSRVEKLEQVAVPFAGGTIPTYTGTDIPQDAQFSEDQDGFGP